MSFRSKLRPLKGAAARLLERIWRSGFGTAARFTRSNAKRWSSAGEQSVLVVAPHPDDEAMGCVGTVLLHVQSGDRVCIATVTDGRLSRVIADAAEMARRRRLEAIEAARLMGVQRHEWMGLPEGNWSVSGLKDSLRALIEATQPDLIYAPSRIDFHPEHWRAAHALALAIAASTTVCDRGLRVRVYQIQVPLNPLMVNLVADVSALHSQCDSVFRAYASQAGSIECTHRHRRYNAAWHCIAGQAEEFWELSARQYVSLHAEPPAGWPNAFRGLRGFPLTDPLAYLVGMRERRRLSKSLLRPSA